MRCSIPEAKNEHQQQANTTPGPCVTENNAPCQSDANLEMGGEETDLHSLPANGSLRRRGVSEKEKESTFLQGMTHMVHNGSLSVVCNKHT